MSPVSARHIWSDVRVRVRAPFLIIWKLDNFPLVSCDYDPYQLSLCKYCIWLCWLPFACWDYRGCVFSVFKFWRMNEKAMTLYDYILYTCVNKGNKSVTGFWLPQNNCSIHYLGNKLCSIFTVQWTFVHGTGHHQFKFSISLCVCQPQLY